HAGALGLTKEFARLIEDILSTDKATSDAVGDYFMLYLPTIARAYVPDNPVVRDNSLIHVLIAHVATLLDTVVYRSRKQFLRQ
ncbi:serine/threonine protein kinase, partial [Pseudoalteromonas ruthenica]